MIGKIEKISQKNKGIKVAGKWFNVSQEAMKFAKVGDFVELETDEKGDVIFIRPINIDKDIRVTRLALLNTATEIVKMSLGDFVSGQGIDRNKLVEEIKKIARELERWVNR